LPNILDIRRRIRSVVNTRQITKAMKVVSAAKLRRAQDRALSARPYAQMLTNVLKSLVARAEIYDPETGEPKHPLLAQRAEKNILLIVVTGDKGLAGAFSANITKAASRFLESKAGMNVDIEAIGRKGRDFLRRRYPAAPVQTRSLAETEESLEAPPAAGERAGAIQITGEHVGVLGKLEFSQARALAESVIGRYQREEIDAVYIVFNEFKSVIAQRLIVEQILPIEQIGAPAVRLSEEMTEEEKKKAKEAAISAGVSMRESPADQVAEQFGTAHVDYIYEQAPLVAAQICGHTDFPGVAGVSGGRTCRAHDRDGFRHQQRHRHDRLVDAGDEPGAAGQDYERDYRDCERRGGDVKEAASF
jgi:F-type H+-transporting ATPase subunit gamma